MASSGSFDGAHRSHDLQPSSSTSRSSSSFTSRDSSTTMGSNERTDPKSLTIRILQEITDNFSEERALGQGAYGKVYMGVHDDGEEVAVKLLYNNMQAINDEQFQHEFDNLMMLNHPNIVRLVGYCYETLRQHVDFQGKIVFGETTYRALCFEYMHMGSLQRHLSDEVHGLDWNTRYKIIRGVCEGLKYLHEGFKEPIYHLDLKPDNILLDENMTPKLADFGLSKLFGEEQTRITYSPVGTIGYMPPEYLFQQVVSKKLDVFSLGVVITKIIAGPKGNTRRAEMPYQEFLDEVRENWRKRLEATCTSPRILEAYCEQVSICTEIGLSSMETDRHERPSIVDIIDRLDDTETMIEKAISRSANSHASMPVKPKRENDDDLVKVETFARSKLIQVAETCDEFPVLVRLSAAPWHHAGEMPRTGVDVVAVFNDNMSGKGWRMIKQSMMMVINKLGPNDRLSIVLVEHPHRRMELTYMSDHGQDVARLNIDELVYGKGRDDLDAALREGAQILRARGVESKTRIGCIMLVLEGKYPEIVNQEISQEFPVHTIGFGDHDYRVMKYITDKTSGSYSFVNQCVDALNYALGLFITGLTSVAATSIKVTLQTHKDVSISSIESGGYGNSVSSDKQSGTIDINYIYTGGQMNFIVYLTVPRGKEKLMTVGGSYQSLNTSKELVDMDVVVLRPRRKCLPNELVIHPNVAAELLRIQLKKGILALQNQYLSSDVLKYRLKTLWDSVKNSHKGLGAPEKALSVLNHVYDGMIDGHDNLNNKYILSWLNCHEWQRPTTKSKLSDCGLFQTLS